MRDFTDPDTHFRIVRSRTPVDVDGFKLGEPTGQIECEECGAQAGNVDAIPHRKDCPQRDVRSRYWAETHPRAAQQLESTGD